MMDFFGRIDEAFEYGGPEKMKFTDWLQEPSPPPSSSEGEP
jgi:hypothetical protein